MKIISCSLMALAAAAAWCTQYEESEPNDTFATADVVESFVSGDTIHGMVYNNSSFGVVDNDYWRLNLPAESSPGLYEYRFSALQPYISFGARCTYLDPDNGPQDWLWGVGDEIANQPDPTLRSVYYGMGSAQFLELGVGKWLSGGPDFYPYHIRMERRSVSTVDLGAFTPGSFQFRGIPQQGGVGMLILLDERENIVASHGHGSSGYTVNTSLSPGTFYLGFAVSVLCSTPMQSFPLSWEKSLVAGHNNFGRNPPIFLRYTLTGGGRTLDLLPGERLATINDPEMAWYKITVVPEPASILALSAAFAAAILRRRRRDA